MAIWPEAIEWDEGNLAHATRHDVTQAEIEQVVANGAQYRSNRHGRAGDYIARGVTDGGRRVVVVVAWNAATRTVRPITAWEDK